MAGFMPMTEKSHPAIIIASPLESRTHSQYFICFAFRLECPLVISFVYRNQFFNNKQHSIIFFRFPAEILNHKGDTHESHK